MPLRVLVVPDKFKGTLSAREAVAAIVAGYRSVRPDDALDELPMSDGGDGFGDVLGGLLGAEPRTCATVDAAGRSRDAAWWFHEQSRVAIVEAAQVNGLALLPEGRYHPFELDSFGLGAVLRDAHAAHARRVYVGLGGSATNDGGFGCARALGWKFRDAAKGEVLTWNDLEFLESVEPPPRALAFEELILAVDVKNPLLGPNGATAVFGPQKGLAEAELPHAEACLRRLADIVNPRVALEPGAGAAGGLGFGLRAFLGGVLESGAEVFARLSDLERRIHDADLVITGEGKLDAQSLMGKGVGLVAATAARAGKPCWCLAGAVTLPDGTVPFPNFRAFATAKAAAPPADRLQALAARAAAFYSYLGGPT